MKQPHLAEPPGPEPLQQPPSDQDSAPPAGTSSPATPPKPTPAPPPTVPPVHPSSFKKAVLAVCAVAMVAVTFWNLFQNRFPWQKLITLHAYSELMGGLNSLHERVEDLEDGSDLNIVVVHAGSVHLATEESPIEGETQSEPFTDRKELRCLIEAIAAQKPKAIGVDIDFSPVGNQPVSSQDRDFFRRMQQISKHVPVYLGVFNRMKNGSAFLGEKRFDTLAAAIPALKDSTLYIPIEIDSGPKPLPSLAYKLASTGKLDLPKGMIHTVGETQRILVNYSELDNIRDTALLSVTSDTIADYNEHIKGKYVLIGDAVQPRSKDDVFRIPGQKTAVPGVYLHACAFYTLAQEHITEIPLSGKILLDLVIIGLIPFLLFLLMHMRNKTDERRCEAAEKFFSRAAELVALLGIALVITLRLFWFDFLIITMVFKLSALLIEWFPLHKTPADIYP